jgi:CheY-like chemotaxis protein
MFVTARNSAICGRKIASVSMPRLAVQDVSATLAGMPARVPTPEPIIRVLLSGAGLPQQRATRELLTSLRVDSEVAQDGVEASRLAAAKVFDVVLIDVDASLLDGLFATAFIRRFERATPSRRPTPVVAYTGMEPPPFEALLKHTGANDVLRKSSAAAGMSECLARWCPGKFEPRSI